MYTPAAPWTAGQTVTHTNGSQWIATGPNSLKKKTITITSPEDCCHYQDEVTTPIPANGVPPAPSFSPAGKSDGDTLHVCYPNGSCYFTCVNGAWLIDFCKIDAAGLTHYHFGTAEIVDGDNPPATPPGDPSGGTKVAGDTFHVCHPNGSCYYTCDGSAWVLDFCKVDSVVTRAADPTDCHYDDAGLVAANQVDAWLDQNLEFDAAGFTATNPCCNTVQGSANSTVDQCSGVHQSVNSSATGPRNVIDAGNNINITGSFNHASGYNHVIDNTGNQLSGANHTVTGTGFTGINQVTGFQNTLTNGSSQNNVGGGDNILDNEATANTVSGNSNFLDEADFNTVHGVRNQLLGNGVQNNAVTGNDNVLDGNTASNVVTGTDNELTGPLGQNLVGGGQNDLDNGYANLVVGTGNDINFAGFNLIGGGLNVLTGAAVGDTSRNMVVGFTNTLTNNNPVDSTTDNSVAGRLNILDGSNSSELNGHRNCILNTTGGHITSSFDSEMDGLNAATILSSLGVKSITPRTVTGGVGAGVKTSANRRWQINSANGNLGISGALLAGAVFPGFGEYGVAERNIQDGLFVQFDGLDGVKVATANSDFDGISRKELSIAAGGGHEAANTYYVHDDMGNRVMEDTELTTGVKTVVDTDATDKAQKKADEDQQKEVDKYNDAMRKQFDADVKAYEKDLAAWQKAYDDERKPVENDQGELVDPPMPMTTETTKPLEPLQPAVRQMQSIQVTPIMKEEDIKEMVSVPKVNANYDAARAEKVIKVGVEMLGRTWIQTIGDVAVGDYLRAGRGGAGTVSDDKTRVRVLAVENGRAFVVIK